VSGLGAGRALVGAALCGARFTHLLSVLDSIGFWEKMGFTAVCEKQPVLREAQGRGIPRPNRAVCEIRRLQRGEGCLTAMYKWL